VRPFSRATAVDPFVAFASASANRSYDFISSSTAAFVDYTAESYSFVDDLIESAASAAAFSCYL